MEGPNQPQILVVINYAMDSTDPIFAHQIEVVRRLSVHFERLLVITNSLNDSELLPENVQVFVLNWTMGRNVKNAVSFLKVFHFSTRNLKNFVIFSHMTEVQSFLIAIWMKLRSIPHFLWYAHKSKSPYLLLSYLFLSGVISSTPGSCPIKGSKVSLIGQGIDEAIFFSNKRVIYRPKNKLRALSIGRIDPAKRIEEIVENTVAGGFSDRFENLTLVGASSQTYFAYEKTLIDSYATLISRGLIKFEGNVKRNQIPDLMDKSDVFVHAFMGSLDKTLVEATLRGLPVITRNVEYLNEFGSWLPNWQSETPLSSHVQGFFSIAPEDVRKEVVRRQDIAVRNHTLSGWVEKVTSLLKNVSK